MNESDRMKFEQERDFERHLEEAGKRPEVPEAVLDQLKQAARKSWREGLEEASSTASPAPEPAPSEGPFLRPAAYIALAAAVVLAVAVGFFLRPGTDLADRPPVVAEGVGMGGTVDLVTGTPWLELEGERQPVEIGRAVSVGATIETGPSELVALRLPSNLSLRVAPDSRIELLHAGVVGLERGAVYVDSGGPSSETRVPGRAIEIRTPLGTARDIGTQFEVRLGSDAVGATLDVRVREGAVELATSDEGTDLASAGEALSARVDGTVVRSSVDAADGSWSWVHESAPPFDLEGASLEEFLAWIVRETHWQVHIEDDDIEARQAEISWPGGAEVALSGAPQFLQTIGLTSELDGTTLVIRRP